MNGSGEGGAVDLDRFSSGPALSCKFNALVCMWSSGRPEVGKVGNAFVTIRGTPPLGARYERQ